MPTCPECGSTNIISDNGEVCGNCGLVITDTEFVCTQSNIYDAEQMVRKNHEVFNPYVKTFMTLKMVDAYGQKITAQAKANYLRQYRWSYNMGSPSSRGRSVTEVVAFIKQYCDNLELSPIIKKESANVARRVVSKKSIVGSSRSAVAAMSIYVASRALGDAVSLRELAITSSQKRGQILNCLKRLWDGSVQQINVQQCMQRIISSLDLPQQVLFLSYKLYKINRKKWTGKHPVGCAAAAVYIAAKKLNCPRTQDQVAAVSKVTTLTIRSRAKEVVS